MLTVPAMLLFGMPGPVANGTNRIAILAQNLVAVLTFRRQGYQHFRLGLTLGLAALPGALVGAITGVQLRGERFEWVLAAVMLISMAAMWQQGMARPRQAAAQAPAGKDPAAPAPPPATPAQPAAPQAAPSPSPRRLVAGHLCMVAVGFWGGLIQVGVGFVLMPVLHRVMDFDLVRVNQYKVLVVLVYTLPALAVFASQAGVMWGAGLGLALGNSAGGWLGAHTSMTRGAGLISIVFNLTLVALVIKLLFF